MKLISKALAKKITALLAAGIIAPSAVLLPAKLKPLISVAPSVV